MSLWAFFFFFFFRSSVFGFLFREVSYRNGSSGFGAIYPVLLSWFSAQEKGKGKGKRDARSVGLYWNQGKGTHDA